MTGTIVNAAAIVLGAMVGLSFRKGLPDRVRNTIMQGLGLAVLLIGFQMSVKSQQILVVVVSLVLGGLTGEILNIEGWLDRLSRWVDAKAGGAAGEAGRAFVTTSLIYCVGAMAIMGSIESGLNNNHQILFTKAALDGVSAALFASTMGPGVAFSALPVFIYQGTITMLASFSKGFLSTAAVLEMSAVGGLLIVGIGVNILGIREIKVGSLLPSIFYAIPLAYWLPKIIPG
ncbi:DUF554 domain-containing protein [Pelotomaculum propionicicum]|uniref:DUF554 domain-containing protein n=1 Tax=Pelotomaculum propionicicum TaxID=258475 RepID=UPI003B787C05